MIQKYTRKEVLLSLLYLAVGTMVGWAIFDHTKLVYFSNRYDRPREEVLVGMLLGAVGFLIIPWMKKREQFTLEMALWGFYFGGLGFGGGGLFMAISQRVPAAYQKLPYWKGMEFTFGALLGIGYAIACYRNREMLKRENLALSEQDDVWGKLPRAATYPVLLLLVVASLWFNFGLSHRPWTPSEGIYTILGCLLLAVAICSEFLAAHIAFSITVVAFFRDFVAGALKMKGSEAILIPPRSLWGITFILAMPVVAYVSTQLQAKTKRTARELLLLTWAGVIDCFAKFFFLLNGLDHGLVEKVFVVETLIVTGMVLAISSRDVEED